MTILRTEEMSDTRRSRSWAKNESSSSVLDIAEMMVTEQAARRGLQDFWLFMARGHCMF